MLLPLVVPSVEAMESLAEAEVVDADCEFVFCPPFIDFLYDAFYYLPVSPDPGLGPEATAAFSLFDDSTKKLFDADCCN